MVELSREKKLLDIRDIKPQKLQKALDSLPRKTGIYIFRDEDDSIIYIGKAKNLKNRIKSYFNQGRQNSFNYHAMSNFVKKIKSLDYVVTDNEYEALVMESNFIKKNRPKYNVQLRDDKSYPYIVITEGDDFPRIFVSRSRNFKKAKYFGPYTNVLAARETLELLRRLFKIRDCKKERPGKYKGKVCLNYHISLCSGPCMGYISRSDYRDNVEYIKMFLKGRNKELLRELEENMKILSKKHEYEKASDIKEKIDFIKEIFKKQKIFIDTADTWDAIACIADKAEDMAVASVFTYKNGELAYINNFILSGINHLEDREVLEDFLKKYYLDMNNVTKNIYVTPGPEDPQIFSKWLSDTKNRIINIRIPKRGEKKKILDMVTRNASLYLDKKRFEKDMGFNRLYKELTYIKEILGLHNTPRRIECYDISNLGQGQPVGSMVVFNDGVSAKEDYRHFRIKSTSGQNDYAMIQEIIGRRISFLKGGSKKNLKEDESFLKKPDLMIIDGGKGQLSAASEEIDRKYIEGIDLISIAKKEEKVYCLKYTNGIKFDNDNNIIKLLTKIRDEAHRFAIEYHRKLRLKAMTQTALDDIKGIGEKKKKYIFEKVGSVKELKDMTLEELAKIKGITYKDALNIFKTLHR